MYQIRHITSFQLPELEPYRTMRQQEEHRQKRIFVAEGEKVVRRLLESRLEVISVVLPEKTLEDYEPLLLGRRETIPVYLAKKAVLERLTGFAFFQGILAVGRIPLEPSLPDLIADSIGPRLFVVAEGLSNAENMGVLIRNSTAFGAHGLVTGETCASPWLRRSVRSSMGTIFKTPMLEPPNLLGALEVMHAHGVSLIAAHPHTKDCRLSSADFRRDICIVFGSEGNGVSAEVLEKCDQRVTIPMQGGVDSLNVGSSSAAFLYEVSRQRGKA